MPQRRVGQRVAAMPDDLVNRFGIVLAVPVAPAGRPSASPAAMGALSEEGSLAAETVTLDASHTSQYTLCTQHHAHDPCCVEGICAATLARSISGAD